MNDVSQKSSGRPPTRILLVEDLPEHRTLVAVQTEAFRQPTIVVGDATTLARGIELATDTDGYECIVADLGLPDGQGFEVILQLAEAAPDKPIVVLTSRTEQGLAALRAGAQDYLVKEETNADLLERSVRHAIARQAIQNELRAVTREVEHLVYSVGHDLRGPLSVANGFMALLSEVELTEEVSNLLAPVQRSLTRIDAITGDLLVYARAVHGPLDVKRVDLGQLVESVCEDLHLSGVEIAPELPTLDADPRILRHLLENLLGNAGKYADPDRPVAISVTGSEGANEWRIFVDDNGVGIPEKDRDRVFDMFARGSQTGDVEGTGVGLAVARRAVERHHGRIWIAPPPDGVGTRLVFTLPTALAEAREAAGADAGPDESIGWT